VLGFRGQCQHPQAWLKSIVVRFGLLAGVPTTGGKRGAAKRLTAELAEGNPVIVLPDRQTLWYRHLPKRPRAAAGLWSSRMARTTAKFSSMIGSWHR
jgi:hypothetical protein